jgi:hypothetical protein
MSYSARDIEERFEEAAQTLRRVRVLGGARGYGSSWPEVVRSAHAAYGYDEGRPMRLVPGPAAISRMEETFDWLRLVEPEDARIIWLRAEGVRWRQICIRAGCARATAWRRWVAALQTIANRLNAAARPSARPQGAPRSR